jgi:hypothetical protein
MMNNKNKGKKIWPNPRNNIDEDKTKKGNDGVTLTKKIHPREKTL